MIAKIKNKKPIKLGKRFNQNQSSNFDETNPTNRMALLTTIVNKGQSVGIIKILNKHDVAFSIITQGYGTADNTFYEVMGFGEEKKDVIYSVIKLDNWHEICRDIDKRFEISSYSRGLCMLSEIDAIAGVSTYKVLSNYRDTKVKKENQLVMKELNNNYELIYSIVNDGYADIVMEAAKKAGATGGTILTGRGTGSKEIEKYFGIVITPEKQIIMILVPKEIKDEVLLSINNAMGINSKGQGITFSMPVNDTCGLVLNKEEK